MPIGVVTDAAAVVLGGLAGMCVGRGMTENFKEKMNMVLGCCSLGMGVSTIVLMKNMPAVVFALILGTALGLAFHLEERLNRAAMGMQKLVARMIGQDQHQGVLKEEEFMSTLVTCIVLFCASGTGIYGAIVSGMTGDHTILISKAILDLFTAAVFACSLGAVVSLVAVLQFLIFLGLFLAATLIYPLTNDIMIADFKACGGFIMLATGFRITKMKEFPIADMVPAMLLVMPFSALWVKYVMPLVS